MSTQHYREETPCETCGQSACGEPHFLNVTEFNASCITKINLTIGTLETQRLCITWAEADALARLLANAGHPAAGVTS